MEEAYLTCEFLDLSKIKHKELERLKWREHGLVASLGDGIIIVYGLYSVTAGEMVMFNRTMITGMALNLTSEYVGILPFDDEQYITEGDVVGRLHSLMSVCVGSHLLGRVVNSLGEIIDGKPSENENNFYRLVEIKAPGVITRSKVNEPLYTGYKMIDSLVPIGRGQRELILGDRQTGKTSLCIDTIISQKR